MKDWLESIYSDGTEDFVSSPSPKLRETVTVRLRMYADAPVKHVLLRSLHNGVEQLEEARPAGVRQGLRYYEAPLRITEPRIAYQFYLICEDKVYFYTQQGVTGYIPDAGHDFVLLADYVQPAWVKEAVFYQIFPERFCNGDPGNDVQPGEYTQDGWPTVKMDWRDRPLPYSKGHCLDFFGGDLEGIRQKLPYLKELGVTALYLNPIFAAPSVHKYDCVDYFHVDPHFGGDEALAALSEAVHAQGMKLILDISINHTGTEHKWFNRDGTFFPLSQGAYHNPEAAERAYYFFDGGRYHGWLGHANMPTLNYSSPGLRDVVYRAEDSVLKKWLKPPYSIDGWRFDVADVFGRNDELQLSHELWPEIRRSIRQVNPQAYILAEDWGDCSEYLQGSEWDSPMNYFGCGRVIRQFLGLKDLFLERHPLLRQVDCPLTAEDAEKRVTQYLSRLPYALQQNQFNLFDSHDVSRLHNYPQLGPQALRAAVIFQFLLPGAASIYYGDEAAIGGWTGDNEGCRFPMPWGEDFTRTEAYRVHRTMARTKAEHRALSHGGMKFLYAKGQVLALARFTAGEAFVGVLSASDRPEEVCLPFGVIGAEGPQGGTDLFGGRLDYAPLDENHGILKLAPKQASFFPCKMKE